MRNREKNKILLIFFCCLETLKQLDLCVFDFIELPKTLGQLYALELQYLQKLNSRVIVTT